MEHQHYFFSPRPEGPDMPVYPLVQARCCPYTYTVVFPLKEVLFREGPNLTMVQIGLHRYSSGRCIIGLKPLQVWIPLEGGQYNTYCLLDLLFRGVYRMDFAVGTTSCFL